MDDPLIRFPGYSLRRAANATGAELAGRLAELGLRQADASALLLIGTHPDITASALGRQLDIQRANMVPLLKRLESDGLIERHAIDGKSQGLVLSAKGRKVRDKAFCSVWSDKVKEHFEQIRKGASPQGPTCGTKTVQ